MSLDHDLQAELNVLSLYSLDTLQEGIKIHKSADVIMVDAGKRLFEKGLISQPDGGFLTAIGRDAVEHLHTTLGLLCNGEAACAR